MKINFGCFPYKKMRKSQNNILNTLNKYLDDYNNFILDIKTGQGKSGIAYTLGKSIGKTYLITSTKQLQDQYINEFKDIKSLKGKSNYICNKDNTLTCDNGICKLNKHIKCLNCPYVNAKEDAQNSQIFLTSYAYFLKATSYKIIKPRDCIIFDEAHMLENQLVSFSTTQLNVVDLEKKYNISSNCDFIEFTKLSNYPKNEGYNDFNINWINNIYNLLKLKINEYKNNIEVISNNTKFDNLDSQDKKDILNYMNLSKQLDILTSKIDIFFKETKYNHDDWLINPSKKGIELTPINVSGLYDKFIKPFAKSKIIFMSGTILDNKIFRTTFGINQKDIITLKSDCDFDPKKSPIYYKPICKMNYESLNNNLPLITKEVEKILDDNKDIKGIIHTSNHKIEHYIYDNISQKYKDRLIIRINKMTNSDIIEQHKYSTNNSVLISPSLYEGTDLKDDLSRFQIIIKMPFDNIRNPRTNIKMKISMDWYNLNMFRKLVQTAGRSTRTKDDYSKTYIFDKSFKWFIQHYKNKKWLDKQFLDRIVW